MPCHQLLTSDQTMDRPLISLSTATRGDAGVTGAAGAPSAPSGADAGAYASPAVCKVSAVWRKFSTNCAKIISET